MKMKAKNEEKEEMMEDEESERSLSRGAFSWERTAE